jgi:hypothetical protein
MPSDAEDKLPAACRSRARRLPLSLRGDNLQLAVDYRSPTIRDTPPYLWK